MQIFVQVRKSAQKSSRIVQHRTCRVEVFVIDHHANWNEQSTAVGDARVGIEDKGRDVSGLKQPLSHEGFLPIEAAEFDEGHGAAPLTRIGYAHNLRAMKHDHISSGNRKAVNLTMDTGVVSAAREAGLNLSQICETALRQATREELARRWSEENRGKMEAWNEWMEKNGLPLARYRQF